MVGLRRHVEGDDLGLLRETRQFRVCGGFVEASDGVWRGCAGAPNRPEAGSLEDPKDFQGLAHFLEHMAAREGGIPTGGRVSEELSEIQRGPLQPSCSWRLPSQKAIGRDREGEGERERERERDLTCMTGKPCLILGLWGHSPTGIPGDVQHHLYESARSSWAPRSIRMRASTRLSWPSTAATTTPTRPLRIQQTDHTTLCDAAPRRIAHRTALPCRTLHFTQSTSRSDIIRCALGLSVNTKLELHYRRPSTTTRLATRVRTRRWTSSPSSSSRRPWTPPWSTRRSTPWTPSTRRTCRTRSAASGTCSAPRPGGARVPCGYFSSSFRRLAFRRGGFFGFRSA